MVQLGQKVRDAVTGFTGIVTSRTEFLNGCVRVGVQPPVCYDKEDGAQRVPESRAFDEEELVILDEQPLSLPGHKTTTRQTGGDRPMPKGLNR